MESIYLDQDEPQEEKIDLQKYYKAIIKRWWLIITIAILVVVPWAIYTFSLPPVYEARAVIRFRNYEENDPTLTESRSTVLTSRSFAEKIVAQMGLTMEVTSEGPDKLLRREIFKHISSTQNPVAGEYVLSFLGNNTYKLAMLIGSEKEKILQEGAIDDIVNSTLTVNGFSFQITPSIVGDLQKIPFKIYPFREAVKAFRDKTRVIWNRSGNLMTITLTDEDPNLAARMTNRLAEIFVQESASVKTKAIEKKSKLLEEQVNLARANLDESDRALKEFKERNAINLDAEQETQLNQSVVEEQRKQTLESYKRTLKDLISKLNSRLTLTNGNGSNTDGLNRRYIFRQISEHPFFDNNATMLVYRDKLKDLEQNWRTIVSGSSEENYRAKEINNEIEQTHVQIENLAVQEIRSLDAEISNINNRLKRLKYNLGQLPTQQQRLSKLTRDNKVLEQQYIDLLAMYREAKISEAVESEDIEILDPAIEPEFPKSLNKKIQASLGGVLGLGLGLVVVIALEIFNRSIRTAEDIKRYLNLQVLGTIPYLDFSDVNEFQDSEKLKRVDKQLVTHDYSPTPIGEAYRSLRTNLLFTKETGRLQSVVVTSNEPADGKSFTTANLSITFAQLKSNTLLIDGDLRRGVLHNSFGLPKEPGFTNYLTRVVPLESVLQETHIPNLTLISCGSLIPNPSELLGSHQMQRFLDEVRRKYDLIIFDSPPLNAATDAVVLGTQVDATAIVIRAGKTNRDIARQKLELYSNLPAKVLGAILNGTTADMAHPGYSYYHY